jgi:hypothetical protein
MGRMSAAPLRTAIPEPSRAPSTCPAAIAAAAPNRTCPPAVKTRNETILLVKFMTLV